METRYTPRHQRRSRLSAIAASVRRALRPRWEYREVSILDVLAEERGSVPTPSLSSRQARWGAVLLALGALLIVGNLVVCLAQAWAFSGLAIPAVAFVGAGWSCWSSHRRPACAPGGRSLASVTPVLLRLLARMTRRGWRHEPAEVYEDRLVPRTGPVCRPGLHHDAASQ